MDRDQLDVRPVPRTQFGDFDRNGWSDLLARQTPTGSLYLYPDNGTRWAPSRASEPWTA